MKRDPDSSVADTSTEEAEYSQEEDPLQTNEEVKEAPKAEVKIPEKTETKPAAKAPEKQVEAAKPQSKSPEKSVPSKQSPKDAEKKPDVKSDIKGAAPPATPVKPQAAAGGDKAPAVKPSTTPTKSPAASPVKAPSASPTKPQAASPAKPVAASPTKPQPASTAKPASPTKAQAASPAPISTTNPPVASPVKAQAATPAESPTKAPAAGDNSQKSPDKPAASAVTDDKVKAATIAQDAKSTEEKAENGEVDQQEKMEAEDIASEDSQEKSKSDAERKGSGERSRSEKRKRSSPSPERQDRKRAAPEIREDEPTIDNDKVALSWYDSDLHIQVDKESFMSARPLTEGAFGYAWAGVRATHGVSAGKICYEVKVTEKLKWDDFGNYVPRGNHRDRFRTDHRKRDRSRDGKDRDSKKKDNEEREKTKDNEDGEKEKPKDNEEDVEMESKADDSSEKNDDNKEADKSEKMDVDESKEAEKQEDSKDKDESKEKEKEEDSKEKSGDSKEDKKEEKPQREPLPTHIFRLGWSMSRCGLQLGEEKYSFGFESTGKFVTDSQFTDFASGYKEGDVIGAYLSIVGSEVAMRFTVNGELQEGEYKADKSDFPVEGFALFPHILSRNFAFEINLGDKEPWFPIPKELEGHQFLTKIEEKIPGPARPDNRSDCEVIMMCGLPASGKSHWVKEHLSSSADKSYTVISNDSLLERMKVSGVDLKSEYRGRWPYMLDKLQKALSRLHWMASQRRRNYILDQTNVYPSAQRRKLQPFEGFKRKAVVIVLGDEEQARRQALQEAAVGSKDVPDSTVLEMKGIYYSKTIVTMYYFTVAFAIRAYNHLCTSCSNYVI
ncbi:unnamed protein product [Acanthoscelides obtectus]|uniref:SPRY domain-containing protein n=1 Tax=Acanthoscelides obtectus TaxID=200917 RepID=A0A9P0LRV5_ACAOB|nr:unnamed protein product [Acanthoscelides obtectus]CAK1672732.1 Heterogeneous nuclear ribonucleoprotein U-like protein 1 [Acanthoscelides obtectus]